AGGAAADWGARSSTTPPVGRPQHGAGVPERIAMPPAVTSLATSSMLQHRERGVAHLQSRRERFRQRRDRCQMAEGLARILDRLGLERRAKEATKVTAQIEGVHAAAAQTPAPEALS